MNPQRASLTARLIAAATVMQEEHGAPVAAPPAGAAAWSARFLSTNRVDRFLLRTVRSRLGRACWRLIESVALPGIVCHWMRRKREIDRLARSAHADGYTQLIVLGAGLDSLAFRLHQNGLYDHVLSADHPATLAVVRAAMDSSDALGDAAPSPPVSNPVAPLGLELLPLDLTSEDARAVLTASPAFDPARATLIVVEGVLMYLPESTVERVLRSLAALPSPRLRLLASWMLAEPSKPIGFRSQSRLIAPWLRRRAEPMLWASTPSALPPMLAKLGWSDVRLIDLTQDDPSGHAAARGLSSEQLMIAERSPAAPHIALT